MAVLLLSALALLSEGARAQPNETDKQAARDLMTRGRAERDSGNLEASLESFSRAHALMHVPTTWLELARAQAALGRWLEALALVRELRAAPSRPEDPPPFARARAEAEELARRLETRMPALHLDLSGAPEPSSATISVDGVPRPDCTQACSVNPGKHLLVVRSRAAHAEEQLSLVEGETLELEVVFSPDPPDPRQVRPIDEEPRPLARNVDRAVESPRVPPLVWILGGVAAAGVAGGVAFGVAAVDERDDLRESCAPRCRTEQVDGVRQRALIANLSFGVGAAAAAGALAAYFIQPASAAPAPRRAASATRDGKLRRFSVLAAPQPAGGYVSVRADF